MQYAWYSLTNFVNDMKPVFSLTNNTFRGNVLKYFKYFKIIFLLWQNIFNHQM